MWAYCTPSWLCNIPVSDKNLKTATTMHMAASLLTSVKVLNSGFWKVKGERTRGRVCLHVWCHEEIVYFIYCVRKKQISNFKVDEISTPSDKCSVSTSIVCDSDAIVDFHNPQIPSENTAKYYYYLSRYGSRYPQTMEPSLSLSSFSWSEDVSEKVTAELTQIHFIQKL